MVRLRFTGLWRHSDFMKLWAGQAVSAIGSHVTGTALPLTALLVLSATPVEMGFLAALEMLPALVIGLLAGAWVDRLRRRPIMIGADLGRALLLATIPLAALFGVLSIAQLYIVAFLVGALTVFFDVSYQSYVPSLVGRDRIVEANSKLGTSSSLAEITGPALGGVLVQIVTAPIAILLDALSFVFSATSIFLVRTREPAPAVPEHRSSVWYDIVEGIRVVLGNRVLVALAGAGATHQFFGGFFGTLYALYAIRELHMTPAMVGVLVSTGGVGALVGSFIATPIMRRFGVGPTILWSLFIMSAIQVLNPLAPPPVLVSFACLFTAQLFGDVAWAVFDINELSLRQGVTPDRLLGRMNASMNVVTGGVATIGLLVGGVLAEAIGLRATIAVAVAGLMLSCLWLYFSPIRGMREVPEVPEAIVAEAAGS